MALQRKATPQRILAELTKTPGRDQEELADAVARARTQVSRWLQRMQTAGLVVVQRENGRSRYFPAASPLLLPGAWQPQAATAAPTHGAS